MSSGFITLHTAEVQGSDSGGMTVYVQVDKILYFTECAYRTGGGGNQPERKGARIALDGGGDLFVKESAAEVQEKLAKALEKSVVVMASDGKPSPCDPVPAAAPSKPTPRQTDGVPWTWDISIIDNGGSYATAKPNGTIVSYTSSGDH